MQGSANLNVMVKSARKAGRSLVKDFREVENLQSGARGPEDFVARADVAAEKIIREELTAARPNYGWLGEISGELAGADPTRRWIVAPLVGRGNYLHGLPHWAVSIALEHKGEVVAGVIFDAAKDEIFVAEKGAGAWMNDARIRVSGRGRMSEALLATGIPCGAKRTLPASLQDLARLAPQCAGIRHWGAPALDLACLAAGRFDGYWERETAPWDVAAGLVILREAGGLVEPLRADGTIFEQRALIAGNGEIFGKLAADLRDR